MGGASSKPPNYPPDVPPTHDASDFCHVAIRLDSQQDGILGIIDARLWADDSEFSLDQSHHYHLFCKPGRTHSLRLDHPRYLLPAEYLQIHTYGGGTQYLQINLEHKPTSLEIRSTKFYADKDEILEFETNLPTTLAAQVEWQSSNPGVLSLVSAGRFKGGKHGRATVTARYENLTASVTVLVRASVGDSVMVPPSAADLIQDTWSGLKVVQGVLLCRFKAAIAESEIVSLLKQYGLRRIGFLGADVHQLAFDPKRWTVKVIVETMRGDTRVDVVVPDCVVSSSSFGTYKPPEAEREQQFWHLYHTEAFPAFEVMRHIQRQPEVIGFVEKGIHLSPAGAYLNDFGGRVKLDLSRVHRREGGDDTFLYLPPTEALQLRDSDEPRLHGNKVVSVAASGWNDGGGIGVDPLAGVAILQAAEGYGPVTASQLMYPLMYFSGQLRPGFRILDLTLAIQPSFDAGGALAGSYDALLSYPIDRIIEKGGLVIVAAGNYNVPIREIGVSALKRWVKETNWHGILTVGGTEQQSLGTGDILERRTGHYSVDGTDYDPPGTKALIDVSAPAAAIRVSGQNNETVVDEGGTSLAAPFVAGVAALVWSVLPQLASAAVKQIILDTVDPIVSVPPFDGQIPPSPPRIWTTSDKLIGRGRVNVWQALLFALNQREREAHTAFRYVGLRVRTPKFRKRLILEYEHQPEETIEKISMAGSANSFQMTRVTLLNKQGAYPVSLRAEELQPDGTYKPVYRRIFPFTLEAIERLSPRFVVTCVVYGTGITELKRLDEREAPPNRARFAVKNAGLAPDDPELLDPMARSPHDKSFRPWMKLADGDSYALTSEVLSGPSGLQIRFLDNALQPLPPDRIDDEGRPYLTVPFKETKNFHVEAVFPPNPEPAIANVKIEVISLNNDIVRDSKQVVLRAAAGGDNVAVLIRPPGWVFDVSDDLGPGQFEPFECACEPAQWKCRIHRGYEGGGGAFYQPFTMKFRSPENAAPGSAGACTFRLGQMPIRWQAKLALPEIEWQCDQPVAAGVIVEGNVARATFAVKLKNHSQFNVHLKDVVASDALLPAHAPPGIHTRVLLRYPGGSMPPGPEIDINATGEVLGEVTVYYAASVLTLPPGTIGTRRIRMSAWDPNRNEPDLSLGPSYPTLDLVVQVPLRPVTPS